MTKIDDCYRLLMSAIVQQSILDYVNSLIDIYKKGYVRSDCLYISENKHYDILKDCEDFFHSPMFGLYSDLDYEILKRKCREFAKKNDNITSCIMIVRKKNQISIRVQDIVYISR